MNKICITLTLCLMAFTTGWTAQDGEKLANVAGMWKMSWEGRNGTMEATLTLEQDGESAKGTMKGGMRGGDRETPIEGTVKGNIFSFAVERETPRGTMSIEYSATVDGDMMKGTFGMRQFTRDWTAARVKEK